MLCQSQRKCFIHNIVDAQHMLLHNSSNGVPILEEATTMHWSDGFKLRRRKRFHFVYLHMQSRTLVKTIYYVYTSSIAKGDICTNKNLLEFIVFKYITF